MLSVSQGTWTPNDVAPVMILHQKTKHPGQGPDSLASLGRSLRDRDNACTQPCGTCRACDTLCAYFRRHEKDCYGSFHGQSGSPPRPSVQPTGGAPSTAPTQPDGTEEQHILATHSYVDDHPSPRRWERGRASVGWNADVKPALDAPWM